MRMRNSKTVKMWGGCSVAVRVVVVRVVVVSVINVSVVAVSVVNVGLVTVIAAVINVVVVNVVVVGVVNADAGTHHDNYSVTAGHMCDTDGRHRHSIQQDGGVRAMAAQCYP